MTRVQMQLAFALASRRVDDAALREAFGVDFKEQPERTVEILSLETATSDGMGVEAALAMCAFFGFRPAHLPSLNKLLNVKWHERHEDVALALEALADPSSVEHLYVAASTTYRELTYLSYDDGSAFARKCIWALAAIGTTAARQKLELLSTSHDEAVSALARKRLSTPPPR